MRSDGGGSMRRRGQGIRRCCRWKPRKTRLTQGRLRSSISSDCLHPVAVSAVVNFTSPTIKGGKLAIRKPGVNGPGWSKTWVKSCNGSRGTGVNNTVRRSQRRMKQMDTNLDMRTPVLGFGIPSALVKAHSWLFAASLTKKRLTIQIVIESSRREKSHIALFNTEIWTF